MGIDASGIQGDRDFPETVWSVIRHAQDPHSPDYQRQVRRLVELYWRPVYCVVRHAWARTDSDAKDLTQEFFATVVFDWELLRTYAPERGSFRGLLRAALSSFLHNTVRDASRKKRGGGQPLVSLDGDGEAAALVAAIPDPSALSPEQIFDLSWNQVVLGRAVAKLEQRLIAEGKPEAFAIFRSYDLEGGSAEQSYADLGATIGLTGPQVKHALTLARARFRDVVTDVVRGYVDGADELAAELRGLFGG